MEDISQETSTFTLTLEVVGSNKVAVIKAVREVTGLGLQESKDLVNNAPSLLKEGATKEDADAIIEYFKATGAVVTMKMEDIPEKTSTLTLTLEVVGSKVAVIKTVRELTGLGLQESKDLVNNTPSLLKEGATKEDVDAIIENLKMVGAVEETSTFTLTLEIVGLNKVAVIKAVREVTGFGLQESKYLVDNTPSLLKEGTT